MNEIYDCNCFRNREGELARRQEEEQKYLLKQNPLLTTVKLPWQTHHRRGRRCDFFKGLFNVLFYVFIIIFLIFFPAKFHLLNLTGTRILSRRSVLQ